MSRASKRRRKERSHDPHWIAVRTLLALYGMRMTRQLDGSYSLYKGEAGQRRWCGSAPANATLEQWTEAAAKADKAPTWQSIVQGLASCYQAPKWQPPSQFFKQWAQRHSRIVKFNAAIEARVAAAMGLKGTIRIDGEVVYVGVDEAGSIRRVGDETPRDSPSPEPPRRGWRGYSRPAGPGKPDRVSASRRPPRSVP